MSNIRTRIESSRETLDGVLDSPHVTTMPTADPGHSILLPEIDSDFDPGLAEPVTVQKIRTDIRRAAEQFRYWHVEELLNQAADLLDRGIRSRAEWDECRVRMLNLWLEINMEKGMQAIHADEKAHKLFEVLQAQTTSELDAEKKVKAAYVKASANYGALEATRNTERARRTQLAVWQARMQVVPTFEKEIAAVEGAGLAKYTANADHNPEKEAKINWLGSWAKEVFDFSLNDEQMATSAQKDFHSDLAAASDSRISYLEMKSKYDEEEFKKDGLRDRRDALEKGVTDFKAASARARNGILNYSERLGPIYDSFYRDFTDALARVQVANTGLMALYGTADPTRPELQLPKSVSPWLDSGVEIAAAPRGVFDDTLKWVRDSIAYMVQLSHREQNYVLTVSLKKLAGASWAPGLLNGTWEQVGIPDALFKDSLMDQRHVRLRGIGAFVVGGTSNDLWQVTVTPPKQSGCYFLNSDTRQPLDQRQVPSCRLGRVQTRSSVRDPDVLGVSSLHNVSPLGAWSVKITPVSDASLASLEDLHLDLYIAMIPKDS